MFCVVEENHYWLMYHYYIFGNIKIGIGNKSLLLGIRSLAQVTSDLVNESCRFHENNNTLLYQTGPAQGVLLKLYCCY